MNSKQIAGYRSRIVAAINGCADGAYVEIDLTTARKIIEICDQLSRIEKNHETPEEAA